MLLMVMLVTGAIFNSGLSCTRHETRAYVLSDRALTLRHHRVQLLVVHRHQVGLDHLRVGRRDHHHVIVIVMILLFFKLLLLVIRLLLKVAVVVWELL